MEKFVGRNAELDILASWCKNPKKSLLTALYGRRRIGKTRLVEEAFNNSNLLKFEGLEENSSYVQKDHFLKALYRYAKKIDKNIDVHSSWEDILIKLSEYIDKTPTVILFDEFQWMASNRKELVSVLKFVWDNHFIKKNYVHLILCGSISSFIVKKVIHSKALYGRIDNVIELTPLSLDVAWKGFMNKRSLPEALDFFMVAGGVPKYLELYNQNKSTVQNLKELCFTKSGYLFNDFERLFISHFGRVKHYENIIKFLASKKMATREEIINYCGLTSGGRTSRFLEELELASFIESYGPVHSQESERFKRFQIKDPYLRFYFKFIYPNKNKIKKREAGIELEKALPLKKFEIWRGFAFEYFCLTCADQIAKLLGFADVNYDYGPWFSKKDHASGFQIDLMYIRADKVITICEVKYKDRVSKEIIKDMEKKISLFPNPKRYTIKKVLISVTAPSKSLYDEGYFSHILTIYDLFS